jgi:hypothetical protein
MTKPKSINELLHGSQKALEQLRLSAERAEGVLEALRDTLPEPLGMHLLAASLDGAELVLIADSGAFATRLRYAASQHRDALERCLGVDLGRIRVQVRGRPGRERPGGAAG